MAAPRLWSLRFSPDGHQGSAPKAERRHREDVKIRLFKRIRSAYRRSARDDPPASVGRRTAKSAHPQDNRRAVEAFAGRRAVLAFDVEAADHATDVRAALARQGRPIGGYDLLIAGHALSRGLIVLTGDLAEFSRIDGLRCEDWG